jgi:hypothetical protein
MIERAPSALVRFEERYITEHFGCFVTLGQEYLPFGPKPELLCSSGQVRLVADGHCCTQNAPDGRSDWTVEHQRLVAGHFLVPPPFKSKTPSNKSGCVAFIRVSSSPRRVAFPRRRDSPSLPVGLFVFVQQSIVQSPEHPVRS